MRITVTESHNEADCIPYAYLLQLPTITAPRCAWRTEDSRANVHWQNEKPGIRNNEHVHAALMHKKPNETAV